MNIYIQDFGWAGCIIVIASSEEEAREMMKASRNHNYDPLQPVDMKEIQPGVVHINYGDS